jgi:hypothetical protein
LTCLYIGLAKEGQERPFHMYDRVVSDLRHNRQIRARINATPRQPDMKPYFARNPWGFRWIHHELEAASHRIANRNPLAECIELRFIATGIPPKSLAALERLKINQAKRKTLGTLVLANDQPSMVTRFKRGLPGLDSAWL